MTDGWIMSEAEIGTKHSTKWIRLCIETHTEHSTMDSCSYDDQTKRYAQLQLNILLDQVSTLSSRVHAQALQIAHLTNINLDQSLQIIKDMEKEGEWFTCARNLAKAANEYQEEASRNGSYIGLDELHGTLIQVLIDYKMSSPEYDYVGDTQ